MRLQVVKDQADESTFQEWRDEDYMNKMNFNPLVMFVVIPTIVQAGCLIFMGAAAFKYSHICLELIYFIKYKTFVVF